MTFNFILCHIFTKIRFANFGLAFYTRFPPTRKFTKNHVIIWKNRKFSKHVLVDDGPIQKMVVSIGWNPFYGNTKKSFETHIIHQFEDDFYGAELGVVVCGYLREEKNYKSIDDLKGNFFNMEVQWGRKDGRHFFGPLRTVKFRDFRTAMIFWWFLGKNCTGNKNITVLIYGHCMKKNQDFEEFSKSKKYLEK